jgi:hypothetical protein
MMQDLFGLHPGLTRWFEPRTVWMYADPKRRHDRFDKSDATPRVIRYVRKRFLKYQNQHSKLRIVEKTPSNVLRIPYMHEIFPEASYLYIIRDALAYLSSAELKWQVPIYMSKAWRRLKEVPKMQLHYYTGRFFWDHFSKRILRRKYVSVWGVRYPGIYEDLKRLDVHQIIAKQWVICSNQAEKDLRKLDPLKILRIRYEDFVDAPDEQFELICRHFNLAITDQIVDSIKHTVDPNRKEKWRRRLDLSIIAKCAPILEDEMARHGYTIPKDILKACTKT